MKKFYYTLLLVVMSMVMVSCEDHGWGWDTPPYDSGIVGSWEAYYGFDGYGEYDILGYDVVRYDFYTNRNGRYYQYSHMGYVYIDFYWETHGNMLYIWYEDGDYEELYYGFNDYGLLVLSLDWRFRQYTVYRPSNYYYEQGKTLEQGQTLNIDKSKAKATGEHRSQAKVSANASLLSKE